MEYKNELCINSMQHLDASTIKVDEGKAGESAAEMEDEEVKRQFAAIGYYPAAEIGGGDR
jgi:hypothetical protein